MANEQNLKPFKPKDPRINRKDRPKSFDDARALAQQIAHEVLTGDGGKPLTVNGALVTRIEAIFREMSTSRDHRKQELFLAYAVGKPKEQIEASGKIELVVTYAEDEDKPTEAALRTAAVPHQPSQAQNHPGGQARR